MDRLRSLIEEEERVVKGKVEIIDDAPPDVRPSLLDNDGIDVDVVRKDIDEAKEYERQQIDWIIQENEEYREVRDNLKSLDLRIRDMPEKPQSDEEVSRLRQLQQERDDALEKRQKLDVRKEKRERDELVEIERIEKRVREEKERLSYLRRKALKYGVRVEPSQAPLPMSSVVPPVLSSDRPWYDLWDRARGYLRGSIATRPRRYRPMFGPVKDPRRHARPMFGPRSLPHILLYRSIMRQSESTSIESEYVSILEKYIHEYVKINPREDPIDWYSLESYIDEKMGSIESWRSRIDREEEEKKRREEEEKRG